ncbi:hypothetical protein CC2G_009699 [Coprinopsis cinerea AmutBmut pab1-1]|nr:hypothetical protein CC2G_009699 [Coprinopsis cinerea AmutBmut pab1-1]
MLDCPEGQALPTEGTLDLKDMTHLSIGTIVLALMGQSDGEFCPKLASLEVDSFTVFDLPDGSSHIEQCSIEDIAGWLTDLASSGVAHQLVHLKLTNIESLDSVLPSLSVTKNLQTLELSVYHYPNPDPDEGEANAKAVQGQRLLTGLMHTDSDDKILPNLTKLTLGLSNLCGPDSSLNLDFDALCRMCRSRLEVEASSGAANATLSQVRIVDPTIPSDDSRRSLNELKKFAKDRGHRDFHIWFEGVTLTDWEKTTAYTLPGWFSWPSLE